MNKTYYYMRCSTEHQHLDRQYRKFKQLGADDRDILSDKESGKNLNRPSYQTLKNNILREGDTLVITSLDRLSRNKMDIKHELEFFKSKHIRVKVLDLPTTLMDFPEEQAWILDMVNNILIEVLGTIAEQERSTILKRQSEGITAAREKGIRFGRPKLKVPDNFEEIYQRWINKEITAVKAMELTGLKKTSFYDLVKERGKE